MPWVLSASSPPVRASGWGNSRGTAARPGQGPELAATVLTAPGRWHLPQLWQSGSPEPQENVETMM